MNALRLHAARMAVAHDMHALLEHRKVYLRVSLPRTAGLREQ